MVLSWPPTSSSTFTSAPWPPRLAPLGSGPICDSGESAWLMSASSLTARHQVSASEVNDAEAGSGNGEGLPKSGSRSGCLGGGSCCSDETARRWEGGRRNRRSRPQSRSQARLLALSLSCAFERAYTYVRSIYNALLHATSMTEFVNIALDE